MKQHSKPKTSYSVSGLHITAQLILKIVKQPYDSRLSIENKKAFFESVTLQ